MVLFGKKVNLVAPSVLVACLAIFLPFARLGADTHHDGYVFQAARLIAHGAVIHREVFYQYGQLSAYIDALCLWLFGEQILILHIEAVVILSFAISFFAESWRRLYGSFVAASAAALCIGTAYFFLPSSDTQLVPWTSDKTLFLLGLLSLIGTGKSLHKKTTWVLIGIICVLIMSTRIQIGFMTLVSLVWLLMYAKHYKLVASLLCSATVLILGFMVLMAANGMLFEWWTQTVIWPNVLQSQFSYREFLHAIFRIAKMSTLPIILSGLAVWGVFKFCNLAFQESSIAKKMLQIAIAVSCLMFALWMSEQKQLRVWSLGENSGFGQGYPHFFVNGYGILWVCFWGCFLLVPGSLRGIYRKRTNLVDTTSRNGAQQVELSNVLCLLIGCSASIGLFPRYDSVHIWWSLIPTVGPVFGWISKKMGVARLGLLRTWTIVLLLLVFVQSLDSIHTKVKLVRVKMEGVPILDGSLILYDELPGRFHSIFLATPYLRKYRDRPVMNMCPDGIYAALTNSTDLPDPYFIDWISLTDGVLLQDRRKNLWQGRTKFIESRDPVVWWCDLEERSGGEKDEFTSKYKVVWFTKNFGVVNP
jgi:hypothetical protein